MQALVEEFYFAYAAMRKISKVDGVDRQSALFFSEELFVPKHEE